MKTSHKKSAAISSESRRNFLKQSGLLGAGLAIGFSLDKAGSLFGVNDLFEKAPALALELTPFILIDTQGTITLINPNPDMGQGSTQAIPLLIAEELEVSLSQVKIIQSDGSAKYGVQISGGSGSVRRAWEPLRKAGAAARQMLIKAASQRWQIAPEQCYAQAGHVIDKKTGARLSYGELAEQAASYEIPQNPVLKPAKDFKLIGKSTKRPDVIDRISGKAVYGIDVHIPGMVLAAILHSPTIHGKIEHINDLPARQVAGVIDVIWCERPMPHRKADAVAVVATSYWAALQGRKALQVKWGNQGDHLSTQQYVERMYQAVKEQGLVHSEKGDFEQHFDSHPGKLEAVYQTPFLAHAPIEPENATVHVKEDGSVEVWAPVQGPDWARSEIAKYLGIIPEKIKVHVTLLGGSFGRKAYHDFLLEACFLSRKLQKPVKLIWSREDDITQGPYRAAMLSHLQGTFGKGKINALHHHAIGESIDGQVNNNLVPGVADPVLCGETGMESSQYRFTHAKVSYSRVTTDIPIVWWRSVYASNFAFGQECFIDELAHKAGLDPLQARLNLLADAPLADAKLSDAKSSTTRHRHVLQVLADKARYHHPPAAGTAQGIAIWKCFESISAACITVRKTPEGIRIEKVVSVIDCGICINPDMVKAQTEGNIIMGLSAAIKPGITFSNGKCDQTNFDRYQVLRISETPPIQVHIIENEHAPGGVGEPGLPPIAPALGNAIYNLTGKRIRKLPLDLTAIG